MFDTSARILKILAAVVWYLGGFILILKGGSLLIAAESLKPGLPWTWSGAIIGLISGGLKEKYFFRKICKKNLNRIAGLKQPKIWQFYRPRFFAFLFFMITAGAILSGSALGNYPFLIAVAALDLSIATALAGSSYVFWTYQSKGR
jgi:hypothetical protein